ncbi:MAG: DUF6377 domain-containing protein [Dysgonamonadaceae bacterium]|nr:DUF6377 domain-containing protein [Dysgonamonadaceae bacterium]
MKRLLTIVFFAGIFNNLFAGSEIDSLMKVLDYTISNQSEYTDKKELRISTLKSMLADKQLTYVETYNIHNKLYDEYKAYTCDSAMYYVHANIQIAEQHNDPERLNEAKLNLSFLLYISGMYKESLDNLSTIDRNHLPDHLKAIYFLRYEHTYLNLCFYIRDEIYSQKYSEIFKAYRDTLLSVSDKSSNEYIVAHLEELVESGQYDEMEQICLNRLDSLSQENHLYAMTAATLADSYYKTGNLYMQKKYLILSAISDMKAAVREQSSLIVLASILYEDGDLQRANNYVEKAMADANFYNARLRNIEIAKIQPVITNAYQQKIENQSEKLRMISILVSILSIFLFIALFYIYRQMRKLSVTRRELFDKNIELNNSNKGLQNANEQSHILNEELNRMNLQLKELNLSLSEANFLKEEYIGHFLDLCSNYIEKLDNYRKSLSQKAAAGQIEDLVKSLKSSRFIDDELKEFYKYFDSSFLRIYPDFVSGFNALLFEEERFDLKKGDLLHTGVRVFALIRLGIEDNAKIASFLRCSTQTVYNYKNKIKNKTLVPRDEFEKWVMKIGN